MVRTNFRLTPEGENMKRQLEELCGKEIHVGFQNDGKKAKRRNKNGQTEEDKTVTVLDVAMWNELGTSSAPSRPFIRGTIDSRGEKITKFMEAEKRRVISGDITSEEALKQVGAMVVGEVQDYIRNGEFVPNAQSTIDKKGSDKPLIDTGTMRQSVHYVIKEKGEDEE